MSPPRTIGHSVRLLNEITSRDGSDRLAFFVSGGRRTALAPLFIGEGKRGRAGP
jgi:hypothetical protein